jgi:hypothetical protein
LICLAAASCGGSKAVDDAGRNGQSEGSPGTGGGVGGFGGSGGGADTGGAGGNTSDAAGPDAPSGGASGADSGAVGGSGIDAAASDTGPGNLPAKGRTGMKSAGCGMAPMGASSNTFTNHRISIPACANCTVPNCPSNCIAPPFVPGGRDAQMTSNGENFLNRDFTVELPANYQPGVPYPAFYGGTGCGSTPPLSGGAFTVPGTDGAIKVGLQQVGLNSNGNCFADGGIRCAPNIANVADCDNGPELPYFLAVMNWVESNTCVDMGEEFAGGLSSGAWEALLAGCGTATTLRGNYPLAGGLREHRWKCNGPIALFQIVSDVDTNNPVGPLPKIFTIEDTFGSAPDRDEILARNGCVGKATAPYDPKYPFCMKYTGCPATYPVVWCEFPGGSHANPTYNGVNYLNAVAPFMLGLPPAP